MNEDFNKNFDENNKNFDENFEGNTGSADGQQTPPFPQNPPEHHSAELVSMILGIISFVLCSCCCVNVVLSIISICYAFKAKRLSFDRRFSGMALAGLILSVLSIVFMVIFAVVSVLLWGLSFLSFLSFFEAMLIM